MFNNPYIIYSITQKNMMINSCKICYLPIKNNEKQLPCPRCFNHFHQDHLAAWLLNNNSCPMCKNILSDDLRQDLQPKNEEERKKIEEILMKVDNIEDMVSKLEKKQKRKLRKTREEEFDLKKNTFADYIKILFPFLLIGSSIFVIILALR